jgi:hypothetical protein
VPTDLKLDGKEEAFNIQVLYDTQELYGTVNAWRPVTVYRD